MTSRKTTQARRPKQKKRTNSSASKRPASLDSSQKILTIVAETDHYVVVDKPALFDSQNSKSGRDSVVDWLNGRYGYSGLVHRLDFGTSGLLVCAKTPESANKLTKQMTDGLINRTYLCVTFGRLPADQGEFTDLIDGKPAATRFKVLERFPNATLTEVVLDTGRKHQIRRHFAQAGHPLLGDHLYKSKGSDRLFHRPALHARKLCIENQEYTSPLPEDLESLLSKLRAIRS
ncbi:MAG: RNA pseudouridine synthase [Bdellovibrionota bacterium]